MTRLTCLLLATVAGAALASPARAITAGRAAPPGAFAFMAALVSSGEPAFDGQFCGGSVVAPDLVLTAAHCVEDVRPRDLTVVTGRTTLSDERSGQRVGVRWIAQAPGYRTADEPDLALVRLTRPVAAQPVALALGPGAARSGVQVQVAGWGITSPGRGGVSPDALREATVTVHSAAFCRLAYGWGFTPGDMLCAGTGRRDSCQGDSGGPLVASQVDGAPALVGVVSFGDGCGDPERPGVYARVTAGGRWLREQLAVSAAASIRAP